MASPPSQAEHLSSGLEKSRCWGLVFKLDSGSNFHAQFEWQQADICFRCQRRWPEDHNRTGMSSWPYPQSQNPTPCLIADLGWWYLTPAHNSTGDPWKAHGRPCGCSARTTCLSLFCFVNIITPKHIYIYIYIVSQFSCDGLTWGFSMHCKQQLEVRNMHSTIPACLHAVPEARIALCTTAFVSSLSLPAQQRQQGSNLGHAEVFFREQLLQWCSERMQP